MSRFVWIKSILCASATLAHSPGAADTVSHRQSRALEDWANHQNTTLANTELRKISALVCLVDYALDGSAAFQYVVSFEEFDSLYRLFSQHVKCGNDRGVSYTSTDGWISIRSARECKRCYIMDPMHPFEGYAKQLYGRGLPDIDRPRYLRLINELKSNLPPAIFAECCAKTTLLKSNIGILSPTEVELYKSKLPADFQDAPYIYQGLTAHCSEFSNKMRRRAQNTCVKVRGNLTACCLALCTIARSCTQSLCLKRTQVLPTQDLYDTPAPQNLANTNLSTKSPKIAAKPT